MQDALSYGMQYAAWGLVLVTVVAFGWFGSRRLNREARQAEIDDAATDLPTLTARGWLVVHRDAAGTQLRRPKRWNTPLLIIGVLLPVLGGLLWAWLWLVASVAGVVALVSYLTASDQTRYIPIEAPAPADAVKP